MEKETLKDSGWLDHGRSQSRDYGNRVHARVFIGDDGITALTFERDPEGRLKQRLPMLDFKSVEAAREACSQDALGGPGIPIMDIDEAYRRIDHDGETNLVADVTIPRGALEEYMIENWFQEHVGEEVEFTYSAAGNVIAHLRREEEKTG